MAGKVPSALIPSRLRMRVLNNQVRGCLEGDQLHAVPICACSLEGDTLWVIYWIFQVPNT